MALDLETWQNPPNVISVISSFEDGDKATEQGQLDHRLGLLGRVHKFHGEFSVVVGHVELMSGWSI